MGKKIVTRGTIIQVTGVALEVTRNGDPRNVRRTDNRAQHWVGSAVQITPLAQRVLFEALLPKAELYLTREEAGLIVGRLTAYIRPVEMLMHHEPGTPWIIGRYELTGAVLVDQAEIDEIEKQLSDRGNRP